MLFQVHGGAWTMGRKEGQGEPLMAHLAERGWVCVTANYRLSPRATWPDHIVDVKRALAWTKANIAEHGGDPGFVVITGGSAGGHLCSLAALTPDLAEFQPGFEDADTSVAAAVPFYGVYDFTNRHGAGTPTCDSSSPSGCSSPARRRPARWEQASPISHVGPHAPPFFVLHGTNDSLVPVEQARAFVDELRTASRNRSSTPSCPAPSTPSRRCRRCARTPPSTPSSASWPLCAASRRPDTGRGGRGHDTGLATTPGTGTPSFGASCWRGRPARPFITGCVRP